MQPHGPPGSPPQSPADQDLIERFRAGDKTAKEILYQRYAPRIHYVALKRTRSAADAEDVRSETFRRLAAAIRHSQLREAEALPGFCYRTIDHVVSELDRPGFGRTGLDPSAQFFDPNVRAAINRAIGRLKARERQMLKLFYGEGLPEEEIASRTGIPADEGRRLRSQIFHIFRQHDLRLQQVSDRKEESRA
jgi:RNA polymerase sigma-70 factor (ECF subfamily)